MPQDRRSILESCDDPKPPEVYRAAVAYLRSGLSLLPIGIDGNKSPNFQLLPEAWSEAAQSYRKTWSVFRTHRPTMAELRHWYGDNRSLSGIAVLGGWISGGLEILDLDNATVAEVWSALVEHRLPGLLEQLVRVQTPRPGLHVYYRCSEFGGNGKLARVAEIDSATGKPKPKTTIEIKGEGGYTLAPPSPRICHSAYKCYMFVGGRDLTQIPTITAAERAVLQEVARSLNEWVEHRPERPRRKPGPGRKGRPGDDFNERADWADILERYGWQYIQTAADGSERWRRPGKSGSISATVNYADADLLYVFSTNASPFEDSRGYTKFHAYALLEHDGDFRAAAAALADQGYGAPRGGRRRKERGVERSRNSGRGRSVAGRHRTRRHRSRS